MIDVSTVRQDMFDEMLAFVQDWAGQCCHHGNGLKRDECYKASKNRRRCSPCQAAHILSKPRPDKPAPSGHQGNG